MNTKPLLSIIITNYNTLDFVKLSLTAIKKLTKNTYQVLINDNGSGPFEIAKLKKIAAREPKVNAFFRKSTRSGSYAHAEAVDLMIEKADTKYIVVLDSDCTFLLKNWDQRLIDQINDKVKIAGTPMAKGRNLNKPDDFPFQFAVLFETETYKNLNISCMPRNIAKGEDTCWQWKPKFTEAGYSGKILIAKNTRDFNQGPFGDLTGIEDFFTDEDELIASHFGRGSSSGAGKYLKRIKIPIISGCLRRCCGIMEKKKWIARCYDIINEQS
ncbi:MAG: glycosyltransferase [Sedimentisphaerales bacterium]|nr:glycosyltransferase [Sedimentisphaerales bacterium]